MNRRLQIDISDYEEHTLSKRQQKEDRKED
jgi:hypothetical protein